MDKVKAFLRGCLRSTTMWFAVVVPAIASTVLNNLDVVSAVLLDPQLSEQLKGALHADPQALAVYMRVIAALTFATRARSIIKEAGRR